MVGGSCDGCTVAVTGATHPRVEHLLAGIIPGLPRVELIHTVVSTEVGPEWTHNLFMAERGELDAPYVITLGGLDHGRVHRRRRLLDGPGRRPPDRPPDHLAWSGSTACRPAAAAVIAIGTCASWGGIPAAKGNVTNSMGVMDYLGKDYRSAFGVPVVNVPGCSPIGDNYIETAAAVLSVPQRPGPPARVRRAGPPGVAVRRDGAPPLPPGRLLRGGRVRPGVRRQGVPGRAGLLGPGGPVQHRRAGHRRRPRRLHEHGRHLHRLHHARLPRQVQPHHRDRRRARCSPPPPPGWSAGSSAACATCPAGQEHDRPLGEGRPLGLGPGQDRPPGRRQGRSTSSTPSTSTATRVATARRPTARPTRARGRDRFEAGHNWHY